MQRTFVFLLWCLALAGAAPQPLQSGLGEVRAVYILPMTRGFDQFLANHLADTSLVVVTDPKLATAVFTDRIGQDFDRRMKELFKPEEPEAEEEQTAGDAKNEGDAKDESKGSDKPAASSMPMGTVKPPPVGQMSSFVRGKGNLFLVDARNSQVIWSAYEKQPTMDPNEQDRRAARIVSKLKKAMAVKKAEPVSAALPGQPAVPSPAPVPAPPAAPKP